MRVLLIGNPAAGGGRGRQRLRVAERHLRAAGARVESRLTERVGHAAELLRDPPPELDRVVACGGDGLVSEVAGALAGGELPLAIVPAGRGNDLARALGIPQSIPLAARIAVEGVEDRIDLGWASGRRFCTIAACGLDAEVSRRARGSRVQLPGPGSYVVQLLRCLASFRPFELRLEHEGGSFEGRALAVAAANTPSYGGGFLIAPQADLRDGLLDVCVIPALPAWRAALLFPAVFTGRHLERKDVHSFRCAELKIETSPPLAIEGDGEPLAATPAHYRCEEEALPVVLPLSSRALTPTPAPVLG